LELEVLMVDADCKRADKLDNIKDRQNQSRELTLKQQSIEDRRSQGGEREPRAEGDK
jgi:hypothetical protein